MMTLLFSGPLRPSPLIRAVKEHLAAAYYKRFLRDNKILGPAVDSYLNGGPRPADALIGENHYAMALVLTEDGRRMYG